MFNPTSLSFLCVRRVLGLVLSQHKCCIASPTLCTLLQLCYFRQYTELFLLSQCLYAWTIFSCYKFLYCGLLINKTISRRIIWGCKDCIDFNIFSVYERAVSSSSHKQYSDSTITNCEVPWPTFGFQANVGTAFSQKKKTDRPKNKRFVLGHRNKISRIARK
jgi:hypothetical protein